MQKRKSDPADTCRAIRALQRERPTSDLISQVEAYLDSKYFGVQSLAANLLSGWQSHDSLGRLIALHTRIRCIEGSDSHQQRIVRAITKLSRPEDSDTIHAWIVSQNDPLTRVNLMPTLAAIDHSRAKSLLQDEWAKANRQSKKLILRIAWGINALETFATLGLNDPDIKVQQAARSVVRADEVWKEREARNGKSIS